MDGFDIFVEKLGTWLQRELPGEDAQYIMAPEMRGRRSEIIKNDPDPRLSAVLALFYPVEEVPHLVLILRNTYDGAHSGQVSFPGGRMEEGDPDEEYTALRETEEEIGVPPNNIKILGRLTELYIPPSRFLVYPFVGMMPQRPQFTPDPKEVMKIIEVSLEELRSDRIVKAQHMAMSNNEVVQTPYYDVQGHVVWGATAMMIAELLEVVKRM